MHLERARRRATDAGDAGSVMLEQIEDLAGIPRGLRGRRRHALEEELAPPLPIPGEPHLLQQVVIAFAVSLEVQAEIQDRLRQQQPSEPAVTISGGGGT